MRGLGGVLVPEVVSFFPHLIFVPRGGRDPSRRTPTAAAMRHGSRGSPQLQRLFYKPACALTRGAVQKSRQLGFE